MSLFVADASVVVKWFVPEIHSDAARRLLMLQHEYFAPDLLFAEAASTIWKKVRRKELTRKTGSSSWPMSAGLASRLVPVPGRRRVCPGECLGWNGIRLDVRCVGNSTEHALDHGRRTARSRIENACRHLTSTASMVGPLDLHVVSRSFVSDTGSRITVGAGPPAGRVQFKWRRQPPTSIRRSGAGSRGGVPS
jgi:hypothetical protein